MPRRWAAAARRMAVLMMFGLSLLGAWIYWHAPTLNELRPQIQRYLQTGRAPVPLGAPTSLRGGPGDGQRTGFE